ncbi:MAG: LpqN/LpqT family lipoprotein [Mycobacterium kyogaense]|uniref:LpqN/LpqT family lipoprotein n=1 Tax=Mycobacterium kyogaense TaxID=2212479 RepID=UPI002FF5CC7F
MRIPALICACAAVMIGVTGCGSENTADSPSPSPSTSAQASAPSSPAPAGPSAGAPTIAEYLKQNNITQTMVTRGQPGVPQLNLPIPPGWADVGADTPEDAYGAIYLEAAKQAANPPAIIARMARVNGSADTAKLLEYAPNAVTRAPGWDGPTTGGPSTLGGFDAVQIAGTATLNGAPTFVARKTVVITAPQALYLLALDAQGPLDQQPALMDAMRVIDEQTTIDT